VALLKIDTMFLLLQKRGEQRDETPTEISRVHRSGILQPPALLPPPSHQPPT